MPPHTTTPPGATARSASGTSVPSGAKMTAASSGSGGGSSEPPAHAAPSLQREGLGGQVAGAGEGEHAPALPAGDLGEDVRSGAEPVKAEGARVPAEAQGAKADQPGAQQGGGLLVGAAGREVEAEALVGHGVLGHAAVEVAPGEERAGAEVLAPGAAVGALAAGPPEPGHPDTPPDRRRALALGARARLRGARTAPLDGPDDLVPEDARRGGDGHLAVEQVQVGAADPAGVDPQQQLPGRRLGDGTLHRP